MYFAFSTTSHTAHDSNCIFPCYSAKIGNVLPTAISCHTLYDYLDPGIQRLIEMGSENNITSAKGHHVCLIILLLQSSFTMRMNLLCVRTFSSCNMSRAVLSVPYFSGTPVVATGHQHRRQATRKTELSDLIRLPTHQLSATVSHFASTRTLHITLLE
jgi:hypothetical protein